MLGLDAFESSFAEASEAELEANFGESRDARAYYSHLFEEDDVIPFREGKLTCQVSRCRLCQYSSGKSEETETWNWEETFGIDSKLLVSGNQGAGSCCQENK